MDIRTQHRKEVDADNCLCAPECDTICQYRINNKQMNEFLLMPLMVKVVCMQILDTLYTHFSVAYEAVIL